MKVKSIIACGLLLLGVGAATTSCEDMFTAENNLVSSDLAPQDTVYQMMGIVKRMQKLADRTVLLGEIRADLVDMDFTVATTDLQQLYNNNVSLDNVYNKPADYYDVINNCNIYLANVDADLKTHGEYYYEKEICAAKCFRAWCYLELAKIYGEVPLVTEPVLTADAAEAIVASGNKANMATILDFCISDLSQYPDMTDNLSLRPTYGTQAWNGVEYDNFFIPVRALLGELYLWRGSCEGQSDSAKDYYINAVRMYHDFFCFTNEERGVRNYAAAWGNRDHLGRPVGALYSSMRFGVSSIDNVAILPCDTVAYYGNVSDLRTVFNSLYSNKYYPSVSPSERIRNISAAQQYAYYNLDDKKTITFSSDPSEYDQPIFVGDLRLSSVYGSGSAPSSSTMDNSDYNSMRSWIAKWTGGSASYLVSDVKNAYIPFYRTPILYLHMAEALNRAGFPETAFAVLKYGLTKKVMDDRSIISQAEFDALCEIKSKGFTRNEIGYTDKENASFVIWPSDVFYNPDKTGTTVSARIQQIGIHALGCGDVELNANYFLPTDSSEVVEVPAILPKPEIVEHPGELLSIEEWCAMQTPKQDPNSTAGQILYNSYKRRYETALQAYESWLVTYPEDLAKYEASVKAHDDAVAWNAEWLASDPVRNGRMEVLSKMILDEEALEGMFEGLRFYDLMRYQMQEGKISGPNATIEMPEYIKAKYGEGKRVLDGRPWYLNLPAR